MMKFCYQGPYYHLEHFFVEYLNLLVSLGMCGKRI